MTFYAPFCLPFIIGAAVMFAVLAWKWGTWLYRLPRADKKRILFGLPTRRTFGRRGRSGERVFLHRRIFRVNPLLGYMHMSLAFGWFLLIAVGWAETIAYLGFRYVPLQGHVFFKYFAHGAGLCAVLRFHDGPPAAVRPLGRGAGLGQASLFPGDGHAAHDKTRRATRVALSALWFVVFRRVWWPKAPRARFTAAGDSSPGASGSGCPGISA